MLVYVVERVCKLRWSTGHRRVDCSFPLVFSSRGVLSLNHQSHLVAWFDYKNLNSVDHVGLSAVRCLTPVPQDEFPSLNLTRYGHWTAPLHLFSVTPSTSSFLVFLNGSPCPPLFLAIEGSTALCRYPCTLHTPVLAHEWSYVDVV